MNLCLSCFIKQTEYKKKKLFCKEAQKSGCSFIKPKKPALCLECEQYIDMRAYFNKHRKYVTQETGQERQRLNCITPCGYGMFAPKFYKKNVIDKRRC